MQVQKRDGRIVPWDLSKISSAIYKAMESVGEGSKEEANSIANHVTNIISRKFTNGKKPTIEIIQDAVEDQLILSDLPKTSKAYIIYRNKKQQEREKRNEIIIPEHVKVLSDESKKYFPNELSEFLYYRTYSRWIEKEGRRETWIETVDRYINFMKEKIGNNLSDEEYNELRFSILTFEVMPSMRLIWSAGEAARNNNMCVYNCSFFVPTKISDFAEAMFISMSATGVGFSVESINAQEFPIVKRKKSENEYTKKIHVIEDSREGWCDALIIGLTTWWNGEDIEFDYSLIRPVGARLKKMGGRASGPGPLKELMLFAKKIISNRQGKRLRNIDVHDILVKIGDVSVAGGVRRGAMLSLSDSDDEDMRHAKDGAFWVQNPQRKLSNNSAVYNEKPSSIEFMREWLNLAQSGSGERGIFNREGTLKSMPTRRIRKMSKDDKIRIGTNPCSEVILTPSNLCNLSEVVCRSNDTEESLLKKVRIATILGTYQSTFTNFVYVNSKWSENVEKERLLGVSLTGQLDCDVVQNENVLLTLKEETIKVNKEYAARFGINESLAITCCKPSGSVSILVNSSSGIHPRYAPYYIRRVRISSSDTLFKMMRDQGWPHSPEIGQSEENATTYVLDFPVKSPDSSITRNDMTAIQQLEYWKKVKINYCEHNPSFTCYVGDDEWFKVGNWVYENWDIIGGVSFLPRDGGIYQLAPYEEISKEKYEELVSKLPKIDFSQILVYENEDNTEGSKELACVGGSCEL